MMSVSSLSCNLGTCLRRLSTTRPVSAGVKMVKMLSKIMNRKKRKWYITPTLMNQAEGSFFAKPRISEGSRKRAQQVSKVLHSYVTNFINARDVCMGQGEIIIDIVHVKMAPDFANLNVYWSATGTDADDVIQEQLTERSSRLRQQLTSLNVIGSIPRIIFIKDTSEVRYQELVKLFQEADFGPDYTQQSLASRWKTEPNLAYKMDSSQSLAQRIETDFKQLSSATKNLGADQFPSIESYHSAVQMAKDFNQIEKSGVSKHKLVADQYTISNRLETDESETNDVAVLPTPSLPFRDDVYNLNHTQLMMKLSRRKKAVRGQGTVDNAGITMKPLEPTLSDYTKLLQKQSKDKKMIYSVHEFVNDHQDDYDDETYGTDDETDNRVN